MKFFDVLGRSTMPFQVFIGGRGIGKTYSALKHTTFDENDELKEYDQYGKFIYMRRMDKEIQLSASEISNPFKRINRDMGVDIYSEYSRREGYSVFYRDIEGEPKVVGYGVALSTFAGLRGVDFSDCTTIIFDEFISEEHVRKIKNEGKVFLNMYETVNRNRELQGEEPVKVYLLANSISLASALLLEIGAVSTIADMIVKERNKATLKEKQLYIELVDGGEVAEAKKETALYKLTSGSDFSKQAIYNQFTNDNLNLAKKVVINEYKSEFKFCDYIFYKHKSREEFYIAKRNDTCKIVYTSTDVDMLRARFMYTYQRLVTARMLFFDDYSSKLVFDTLLS